MVQQISETAVFFKEMAPVLTANVLTVTLVYCFAKIPQLELEARALKAAETSVDYDCSRMFRRISRR